MEGAHGVSSCCFSITVSAPAFSLVAGLTSVYYSRNIPGDLACFVRFLAF